MKSFKILATGLVAAAAVSMVSAQTTVRVTGSTAFRAATITSIQNLLAPGFDSAYSGSSLTGFQYGTFVGTGKNGSPVAGQSLVIQCSWTGSVEGVRDVATGLNQTFIKASYVTATPALVESNVPTTNLNNATIYELAIPNVALADNAQSSTLFTTPALQEFPVGVIPFVFLKGQVGVTHPAKAAFDSFTNITSLQARSLLGGGIKLSLLTGAADASDTKIYGMGRNNLSGTRVVTFTETGYGSTSTATQYKPVITGNASTGTVTGVDFFAASPGFNVSDNGYTSGGTLADELGRLVVDIDGSGNLADGVPFGLIGYVGISDASRMAKNIYGTNVGTNYNALAYNGVQLVTGYDNVAQAYIFNLDLIKQGRYTLWGYVQLSYRKSAGPNSTTALAGVAKTFADALKDDIILTVPGSAGVKLSEMSVERSLEGAVVFPKL